MSSLLLHQSSLDRTIGSAVLHSTLSLSQEGGWGNALSPPRLPDSPLQKTAAAAVCICGLDMSTCGIRRCGGSAEAASELQRRAADIQNNRRGCGKGGLSESHIMGSPNKGSWFTCSSSTTGLWFEVIIVSAVSTCQPAAYRAAEGVHKPHQSCSGGLQIYKTTGGVRSGWPLPVTHVGQPE